mmetsp:Transcript_13040/g.36708  ORF Transcript_13040/g.36708 Transcript_13040/m.36708 type:complete len:343 (-) Transcript_13040:1279-2307(-)
MLLQEREHNLYCDGETEDNGKSQQVTGQCGSAISAGFSNTSSRTKISLLRSEFDLASFNSLASSCSDTSSCYSPPTRRSSTLRHRGQQCVSALSSQEELSAHLREGAATQALIRLAEIPLLEEVREESATDGHSLDAHNSGEGLCSAKTSARNGTMSEFASTNHHHDKYDSIYQYVLEGILLQCLLVPFLNFTIRIERFARSLLNEVQCNQGFPPSNFLVTSSIAREEKPIDFDGKELGDSLANICTNAETLEDNEDTSCHSSTSFSTDDDNLESDQDEWGHFADFHEELADESSFIPSCTKSPLRGRSLRLSTVTPPCIATLGTLTESQEEDDETREDWSF